MEEDLPDHVRWDGLPSLHPWQGKVCCLGLLDAHWSGRQKLPNYLWSTLDDEISPCVRFYGLEYVEKRTDETIDALIDHIHKLACHALIGDGSDVAVEFEVQCRLIPAIPNGDIWLWKELLKVSQDKGVSHILEICHAYYAVKSGAAAMCAGKTINAVKMSHWPQKQAQKHLSQHLITHASTHLGRTIALSKSLSAKVVWRKDIGKQSVIPARKTKPMLQWTTNQKVCLVSMERRGRRMTS